MEFHKCFHLPFFIRVLLWLLIALFFDDALSQIVEFCYLIEKERMQKERCNHMFVSRERKLRDFPDGSSAIILKLFSEVPVGFKVERLVRCLYIYLF